MVNKHAILIDPNRPQEIAHVLQELAIRKELRDIIMRDSKLHIDSNFSWEKVVDTFFAENSRIRIEIFN